MSGMYKIHKVIVTFQWRQNIPIPSLHSRFNSGHGQWDGLHGPVSSCMQNSATMAVPRRNKRGVCVCVWERERERERDWHSGNRCCLLHKHKKPFLANHYLPIMSTLGNGLPLIDHVHCWIHEGVVGVLNAGNAVFIIQPATWMNWVGYKDTTSSWKLSRGYEYRYSRQTPGLVWQPPGVEWREGKSSQVHDTLEHNNTGMQSIQYHMGHHL